MKLFSIIIPAHNEEKSIGKCMDSVLKQEGDSEIVIVNDGSSDKTKSIVEKYMRKYKIIKLVNFTEGHSAAFARNRGVENANGEWIIFIDADQIIGNDSLKNIEKFISENKDMDGSDYLVFSYKPRTVFQKAWSAYRKCYPSVGFIHVIRKDIFEKMGGFNEKIFYFEDSEFRNRFIKEKYSFKGPVNAKVYHIEPEEWKEFIRQRKWQGRQAVTLYFLPCVFPPLMLMQFFKIMYKSKDFVNTIYWTVLDFIGRYVSLFERIKAILFCLL